MISFDFSKKVVLVTGGSRGIGKAAVDLFDKAGANVVFTYFQDENAANNLQNSLENDGFYEQIDFKSEIAIQKMVEKVIQKFGRIDILVNNAGIWNYGKAESMSLETWENLMQVNLTGMFLITKAVLPIMIKQKYGKIVNVSSTAAQRGEAEHSHYAASKGAMVSYTKSLSTELAKHNITVNSVAPGWVDTDMNNEVFSDKEYRKKVEESIPIQRIATIEDIAYPILFIASDFARHITGEILNVNGGSVLCG